MMHVTENQSFSLPLDSRHIIIGRDPACEIEIRAVGVSRRHAEIHLLPAGPSIRDLGSTFGIRINQTPVQVAALTNGSTITFGVVSFTVHLDHEKLLLVRNIDYQVPDEIPQFHDSGVITIGRDSSNTIQLTHPLVSRFHCTVSKRSDGRYSLVDHNSTNGTFVNGAPMHQTSIGDGDVIQIGPYRFMLDAGMMTQADDSQRIKLEAHGITLRRGRKLLLDQVNVSIQPGEFVAILGPSGAGKTTLAKVLTGQMPADSGTVYYNGFPLNKFAAAFRSAVGYVTQHNLLRPELTVWETFCEQALLRLPKDSLEVERVARIREVMTMLDITPLSKNRIGTCSGGEAKRVHLGIELLCSPTILFLDEPFAGLDPGLIHKFMLLFRQLCKNGYTLLLTTHTLEQIELCDRIFFISGGKCVFQGTPKQTIDALKVSSLAETYEKLREGSEAFNRGSESTMTTPMYEKLKNLPIPKKTVRRPQSAGFYRQLFMLITRYCKVILRDPANLLLILMQAPLLAFLLALVFNGDTKILSLSFYFCVTISAIWIGGVNTVREIAREHELFDREYRAGLSSTAYVGSKIVVFSFLALLETVLFSVSLNYGFFSFSFSFESCLLIAIATISGTILGLTISAYSGNVSQAVSLLPIMFIPQIFFSGILIPFDCMPVIGRVVSYATISRPSFSMFKRVFLLDKPLASLTEWKSLLILNVVLIILLLVRMRWYRFFTKTGR